MGKRVPRVDALDKVTGRATFGADVTLPGTLFGAILRSPYPHARIKRLEVARALRAEGVAAIITGEDFLQALGWTKEQARQTRPHFRLGFLAWDKVVYAGQPVAAVAAITRETAQEALGLIQVEYEGLPAVLDAEEAMRPGATLIHPGLFTEDLGGKATAPSNLVARAETVKGEVAVGFAQADVILEDTFRTQMVHPAYLEPHACTAQVDSEGKVTVWSSTQGSFNARQQLSQALNMPQGRIKVVPTEVGGAFGGKADILLEPLGVLLAQKAGRPVKMVMAREEEFLGARPAGPVQFRLKMGATKEGHLTAAQATVIYDVGAYPADLRPGPGNSLALYRIPHLASEASYVVTNKPPTGFYRAPAAPPASFAVESMMDMLAQALGLDPLELRLRNAVAEGDVTPDGVPLGRIGFRETLDRVKEHPAWRRKLGGGARGRGLACALWLQPVLASAVHLHLNPDGSMSLLVGSIDITGLRTAMAQIVAEEFGLDMKEVTVTVGDTESVGYTDLTGGSRTTRDTGMAVYRACQEVKAKLQQRAAAQLRVPPEELEFDDRNFWVRGSPQKAVSLQEIARNIPRSREGSIAGEGQTSRLSRVSTFAVHVADVEVDRETGKVKVLAYTAAQEVGFALNPLLVEGQIQGGVSQGLGWALTEGYVFHRGVPLNPNFLDYRVPTATDVPKIEPVIVEVPAADGPYGARGVGEPPIIPSLAAVANAIARAVGTRLKETPMTPEAVLRALQSQVR